MYQHPHSLDLNASHYQQEALRDAANRRLVAEAQAASETDHVSHGATLQRRMVAMAVALVTVLGLVALMI
jgi:hypothetical protein